jgi:MFS family permease
MPLHILGVVLVQATSTTLMSVISVLAIKRFGANEWQSLLVTAAPTVFFTFSIFWNDLFSHTRFARYMFIYWLIACLPLAIIGAATQYWMLLIPHLLCSLGGAGYHPASGELLKRLYPAASRGRIYSVVWGTSAVAAALFGTLVGRWLHHDENSFRWFLPLAAGMQFVGVLIFCILSRITAADDGRVKVSEDRTLYERVVEPVTHTREVLAADPVFARYEAAYMTYGVGWMICYALLPILGIKALQLTYEQVQDSTQVAYLIGLVLMLGPAGYLMDRLGPVRSTGLSFLMLTAYPLGLIAAHDPKSLGIVSFVYGLSHAGTSMGWMLGPVALAPSPEKVPQYVAIHATFVGIRGKIFQLLGVGLYTLTQSFTLPLLLAAAAFVWSAIQMLQLSRLMEQKKKAAAPPTNAA